MVFPLLGAIGGALISGIAAKSAANKQASAAKNQTQLFGRIYEDQKGLFEPYREGGQNALAALLYNYGLGDRPEGYEGFTATPGYDYRLKGGVDAIDASAAARGGLFSGSTGKALTRFGQDYATNEYRNHLAGLAGLTAGGQASAAGQSAAAGAYGANAGTALANLGDARAAGTIGFGNALTSGINNSLGIWRYMQGLK